MYVFWVHQIPVTVVAGLSLVSTEVMIRDISHYANQLLYNPLKHLSVATSRVLRRYLVTCAINNSIDLLGDKKKES